MRILPLCVLILALASPATAQPTSYFAGGVRAGYGDSLYRGVFREVEASVRYVMKPLWQEATTWTVRGSVEMLAGAVSNARDTSLILAAGPAIALGFWRDHVVFDTGTSMAMITDHTFERVSLGTPVQFITHWRLRVEFRAGLSIGYRYQHMSNGGLGVDNPGLNLHMAEFTVPL